MTGTSAARRKAIGAGLTALTGAATASVILMLVAILANVVWGGAGRISWAFLAQAPSQGMTAGGIFPAIYGTVLMTLVMTVQVFPASAPVRCWLRRTSRRRPAGRLR